MIVSLYPLVQYIQQFYDGHISGWFGLDDFDANSAKR